MKRSERTRPANGSKPNTTALKPTLKVRLTGDERFWIQAHIEKLKPHERTLGEKRLLRKVK